MSCPFSDHDAVVLDVSILEPIPRGPGRWKLNVSILKYPAFVTSIYDFWMAWRLHKPSVPSLQDWWDREREILKRLALQL